MGTPTGRRLIAIPTTPDPAAALAFRLDGRYLAAGSLDRTVRLWEAGTGREALVLRGQPQAVGRLAFRPDGTRLTTTSADKAVRVWDVAAAGP